MSDILIRERLKGISNLPTLPAILAKLIKAFQNENSSIDDIAEILKYDQSTTSRIVAVANSPFFGYSRMINSIEQAVLMLGFNMVKSISLGVSVFGLLPLQYPAFKQMWVHSYGVATLSGLMCSRIPVADPGICFLSGLLHDIGRAVFLKLYRNEYLSLHSAGDLLDAEKRMLLCDHAEAGALFLQSLSLPDEIISPVRHHHDLNGSLQHTGIADCVYLSEGLINLLLPGVASDGKWTEAQEEMFEASGMGDGDMEEFKRILLEEESMSAGFFEL